MSWKIGMRFPAVAGIPFSFAAMFRQGTDGKHFSLTGAKFTYKYHVDFMRHVLLHIFTKFFSS
jgi:hypothetical protein